MSLDAINERLADVHRGRRWILTGEVSAGDAELVTRLREWGAAGVLVLAAAPGIGEQPDAQVVFTGAERAGSMMAAMRAFFRSLVEPSEEVVHAVEAFDPSGEALVVLRDVHVAGSLLGRRVYGPRSAAAGALEDKTVVDELWDAAGVERAPTEIVPVDEAPAAAGRLGNDDGSVWVADNRLGWHGGGDYVRWIGPEVDPAEAVAWFRKAAHRVRVMPFLDGIPCSIHGFVTADGVATFRPCELVTLRRIERHEFMYGGVATYWDPTDSDRAAMRGVARRTALELGRRVGYRGPFSVDGVMTVDGFRPTELNPRLSKGMGDLASTVEGLDVASTVRALREGDLDVDAGWLESIIVKAADTRRTGSPSIILEGQPFPGDEADAPDPVIIEDGTLRSTDDERAAIGTVQAGDNPAGSFVRLRLDPDQVPAGPSVAPLAVALVGYAEERWGFDIGPVTAAPDVRRGTLRR